MDSIPSPNQNPKVIFPEQWHPPSPKDSGAAGEQHPELPTPATSAGQAPPDRDEESARLPALPASADTPSLPPPPAPRCGPLVPENSDFLEGDAPAADKVAAFLARALEASDGSATDGSATVAGALVPWICDALLSNHSVKAYGRDFMDFVRQMQAQGVTPLEVTADHVKLYKRALLEAGKTSATVARRLSVLRGVTSSSRPRGWSPGRPPRTSPPSRPPASRRTPPLPSRRSRPSPCWKPSPPTACRACATWRS